MTIGIQEPLAHSHQITKVSEIDGPAYRIETDFIMLTSEFTALVELEKVIGECLAPVQKDALKKLTEFHLDILYNELTQAFVGVTLELSKVTLYNHSILQHSKEIFEDCTKALLAGTAGEYYPRHSGIVNVGHFRRVCERTTPIDGPIRQATSIAQRIIKPRIEEMREGELDDISKEGLKVAIEKVMVLVTSLA